MIETIERKLTRDHRPVTPARLAGHAALHRAWRHHIPRFPFRGVFWGNRRHQQKKAPLATGKPPATLGADVTIRINAVDSRYNVPRLQRIHRYNVLFPSSRFHVMEKRTVVTTNFFPSLWEYAVTRLKCVRARGSLQIRRFETGAGLTMRPNAWE